MTLARRRLLHLAAAAAAVPAASRLTWAQAYPNRPLRFIVGYPPGGGADNAARIMGSWLAERLAQPVVIENRPGGQNVIGAQAAARSPADGYTFYYATTAAMVTNAYTFKSLPYDPVKDFVPVRLVGRRTEETPLKAFLLQVVVQENHQNGRDTHIRQIDVFGPRSSGSLATEALDHVTPDFSMYSTIR